MVPAVSRTQEEVRPLADREVAVVESAAALEFAYALGLPADAEVSSDAPALVLAGAARAVEGGEGNPIGGITEAIAEACQAAMPSDGELARFLPCMSMAAARMQSFAAKASRIDPALFRRRLVVVGVETGDPVLDRRLNGHWDAIFEEHPDRIYVKTRIVPPKPPSPRRSLLDLWMRVGMWPGTRIVEAAATAFWRQAPLWAIRNPVLVLSRNEFVRETVTALSLRGRPILELPRPRQLDDAARREVEALVRDVFASGRSRIAEVAETFLPAFAVRPFLREMERSFVALAADQETARWHWTRVLATEPYARAQVALANVPRNGEELGFLPAARAAGIPLVCFQHGVSREWNSTASNVRCISENALADLFLCFNERCADIAGRNPFAIGETRAVGLPSDLWRVGSRRPPRPGAPPIIYASTGVYGGSVNIDRGAGMSDPQIAAFEIGILRDVLAKLPHRVLYKTYSAIRYADVDPLVVAASGVPNVTLFDRDFDLRFLLPDARVIVTSRATSTLSWCLMSEKPLVFIDIPDALPLDAEARRQLEPGIFLFDAGAAGFAENLRAFLSKPIAEIERLYAARRSARLLARDALVQTGGPGAGTRAAKLLIGRYLR
jgi:hypothetical protein